MRNVKLEITKRSNILQKSTQRDWEFTEKKFKNKLDINVYT